MNKQELLLNICIFLSALCLIISVFTKWIVPTILAVILAMIAQYLHRRRYPKKASSFKGLLQQRYEKE